MRCKKSSYTLNLAQRLHVLRTGKVYVYATGVKEHATIVVSPVDVDLSLPRGHAAAYVSPADVPLWFLAWRALRALCIGYPWLMMTLWASVVVAVTCVVLARW